MPSGAAILIVDDDAARREWLAAQVAAAGAIPTVAPSGAAALAHLATATVDAALLAVRMTDAGAPTLLTRLAAVRTPVLVIAGAVDRAAWSAALVRGAAELAAWPIAAAELAARLRTLTAPRRARAGDLAQRLLDSLAEPAAIVDERGALVAISQAWRAALPDGDRAGGGALGLGAGPVEGAAIARGVAQVLAGELATTEVEYARDVDGARRWYACRIGRLEGGGAGAVVRHVDVTAARAAERAWSDQAQRMQLLLTTLPLVLWEAVAGDDGFAIRWVSANAADVLGVAAERLTGPSGWIAHVHPDDLPDLRSVDPGRVDGQQWLEQYRWVRPDGGVVHLQAGVTTRPGGDGRALIVGFALDVSDAKRLERRLTHVGKMDAIGQLTGGIAHDFNNLLAVILSFAGFVHADLPEGDARRGDLDEVLRAATRGVALIRQLLVFSRQQPQVKRPVDVNATVAALTKLLARTVGENVELRVTPSPRAAVVYLDPVQIDQVVMNLAVNARDAMPDGGALRIAISHPVEAAGGFEPGRYVRLTVADTGSGMDAATAARVFEPFFTTKGVGRGTGLGLATCDAIVHDAGGTIRVDTAPGRGTTFTIDLPACDLPVEELAAPPPLAALTAHERVLVVEDDVALRKAAVRILAAAGYQVSEAADGEAAMRWLDDPRHAVDLIFTDVVMPHAGGHAVAAHARRRAPDARVLLTSGYLDGRAAPTSELEPLPLLWKPYAPASLLRAARATLDGGREAPATTPPPMAPPSASAPTAPAPSVAPPPPAPADATAGAAACRVLMVEDDPLIAAAHRRILTRYGGCDVALVETLADARDALADGQDYAVILCDLTLPDGSGAELLTWLGAARPELAARAIVLTGGAVDAASQRVIGAGETEILHKPVDPDLLLARVAAVAARAAAAPRRPRTTALGVLASAGTLTLPPPRRAAPPTPPITPVGAAVLVVEADPAVRAAYAAAITAADLRVVTAASGEAALARLGAGGVDVVVTELALPDLDGLELVRRGRADDPDLAVLVITGTPTAESAARAVNSGAAGYLVKPFPLPELTRAVAQAAAATEVARLRRTLLATRLGTDELLADLAATRRRFAAAMASLRVAFQPVVRAHDHSIYGFEALLRCDEPTLPTPPKVLAAAAVLGRSVELGRGVRAEVARAIALHPDRREAIFVNLQADELRGGHLRAAAEPLARDAARIVFELSEREALALDAAIEDEVRALRAVGFRFALEHLGEGAGGLSSLTALEPDIAKLDVSLVRSAPRSPLSRAILGSLINVCRRAGITTVAVGAETADEVDLLTDLGVDLIQGFYFAHPGPAFPPVPGG